MDENLETDRAVPQTPDWARGSVLLAVLLTISGVGGYSAWTAPGSPPALSPVAQTPAPLMEPPRSQDEAPLTRQQRIAQFIAEEWRVGLRHSAAVVQAAFSAARRYGLDPILVLAMAAKESSFRHIGNPDGGQDPSRPYGIMQVAGRWHPEKFEGGVVRATSVAENVDLGAQVIREYLDKERGDERRALLRYNGSLENDTGYFREVSRLRKKLRQVESETI